MPGELPGGMPWGSKTPERSNLGRYREAAELASEAARAEGASIPGEPSGGRADGSGTAATSPRPAGAGLAPAADQAEQAGPLLGVRGDQQPHGGSAPAASEP
jgi:hypothetical protein